MIPNATLTGVSYGDYFYYKEDGQLWMFGGLSEIGASCGLVCANSKNVWSSSSSDFSSRLAYYGPLNRVTTSRFKQLAS